MDAPDESFFEIKARIIAVLANPKRLQIVEILGKSERTVSELAAELETAQPYSLTVVDGGPGHPTAARFEVRDGDTPVDSGERSEVRSEDRFDVVDGDDHRQRAVEPCAAA